MVPGTQQVLNGWHVWPTTEGLCFVQDSPCPSILSPPPHKPTCTCHSPLVPLPGTQGPLSAPVQPQYTAGQKDRATALKGWA